MTSIDPREAASALSEVQDIVSRVRQSRIYHLASLIIVMWGVLTFAGYISAYLSPRTAGYGWLAVYVTGLAGSIAIGRFSHRQTGIRTFDMRALLAFLLFIAFGIFSSVWLGHFTPRQMGTFWTIDFMMVYTIAGLWVGKAFVAIGLSIIVLTLIGFFYIGGAFDLWMAVVNGGGLMLGGLWMRRS